MASNGTRIDVETNGPSWFTSEVQLLQGQMGALQAALESSRHAVEVFHQRAAANLAASEQRYRELFDNVLSGVYRMSPGGRLLLANPAFVRMLGFDTFEELAGRTFSPPERLRCGSSASHVIGLERTWKRKNGERITVRESCKAVRGENTGVLYFEGVVEDITASKRAEVFERDCRNLLERVARNEPLDRIVFCLARLIERQAPGAACCLMLRQNETLYPSAAPGLPSECSSFLARGLPVSTDSSSGAAVIRKQLAGCEDLREGWLAGEWRTVADANGLRSCWSVPICSGRGIVLGTIDIYRREPHTPSYTEIHVLEVASRLASVAIDHRQLCDDLEHEATRDKLTGLPNRTMFERRLSTCIDRARDGCGKVAVIWFDLDRFKEINDTLGHDVGDELLRQVARRLEPMVHSPSMLARTGGDEFAIVAYPLSSQAEVGEYAQGLVRILRAPFQIRGFELFVTASAGISIYPDHGQTAAELQRNADAAIYRVKNQGKNGCAFYEPSLGERVRQRMELANSLQRSLERHELELHYQPQIDLNGNLRGLEALLRWNHPNQGVLCPGQFIAIAEETGLIVPIGAWVIQEACRQCAEWNARRTAPIKVAVNVSALQFYFSDLVHVVRTALGTSQLDPSCLELELTESVLMRDAPQCAAELGKLRDLGVTIAIDDFGTGYSSLSYLQQLPVDVLKIDRSFLLDIGANSAASVVGAITTLAHGLGLCVLAEGIEQHDQMNALPKLGVDLAQGFLIGRPAPADVIENYVRLPWIWNRG